MLGEILFTDPKKKRKKITAKTKQEYKGNIN